MLEIFNAEIVKEASKLTEEYTKLHRKFNAKGCQKLRELISIALDWCEDNNTYDINTINKIKERLGYIQYSFYGSEGVLYVSGSKKGWFKDFIDMMETSNL